MSDAHHSRVPSSSTNTVSGVPIIPIYTPPLGRVYGQQEQFPPPMPYYSQPVEAGSDYKSIYYPPPPPSYYFTQQPLPYISHTPVPPPARAPTRARDTVFTNFGRVYTFAFEDETVRSQFSQIVLGLLTLILVASTALSGCFLEIEFMRDNILDRFSWLAWIAVLSALVVVVYSRLQFTPEIDWKSEFIVFAVWSVSATIAMSWITGMLESEFLMMIQLLLATLIGTTILVSIVQRTELLTVRSTITGIIAMVITAVAFNVFYAKDPSMIIFGIFLPLLLVAYVLFRLHYLMGDERRGLLASNFLTACVHIIF